MLKPSEHTLEKTDGSIKQYIDSLEANLSEYQKRNIHLQEQNSCLHEQNSCLQEQNNLLQNQNVQFQNALLERDGKIEYLLEQLKLKNRKIFSSSSEKTSAVCSELPIFNEPEAIFDELTPEEKFPQPSCRNKKQKGHKENLLKELPTQTEEIKLGETEQICSCCGKQMHEMGFDEREELIAVTQYKVRLIREYKYSCRHCEQIAAETFKIVKAKGPRPVIEKSYASAELLAHIIGQKYFNASSLYRIERSFALSGLDISRQTMSNWMIYLYEKYFSQFYDCLYREFLKQDIIQADETAVQVLREEGKDGKKKSYMWVYRTSGEAPNIVLYDYQPTREGNNVFNFLKNFTGKYLQSDGFEGYQKAIKKWSEKDENGNALKDIKLMGCWAHARRKFVEAVEVLPAPERDKLNNLAVAGLRYINDLYKIYNESWDDEKARSRRLEQLKEHLDKIQDWMKKKEVLPKTHSGRAVQYLRNQWPKLITFLENENISLDNNAAERAIRLFVMGRKNWLFAVTPSGAKASAVIYSIIQTAQANRLNPIKYIEYLLSEFPNLNMSDENVFEKFTPWNEQIQRQFFSEGQKGI